MVTMMDGWTDGEQQQQLSREDFFYMDWSSEGDEAKPFLQHAWLEFFFFMLALGTMASFERDTARRFFSPCAYEEIT
jgi:hypothetical protein